MISQIKIHHLAVVLTLVGILLLSTSGTAFLKIDTIGNISITNDIVEEIRGPGSGGYQDRGTGNEITFRDDQIMLVNEEPYFPIGIYFESLFPWNSVNDYSGLPSDLEGYSEGDMYFFGERLYRDLWLYYQEFGEFDEVTFQNALQSIDHTNFLGWYARDEPVWDFDHNEDDAPDYDFAQLIYDKLKEPSNDPDHPIWMNFAAADINDDLDEYITKRRQWAQAADIISFDVYPKWSNPGPGDDQCCACQANPPYECGIWCVLDNCELSVVGEYVDLFIDFIAEGKPVWAVPQAWGAVNEQEIRFQSYQAIIHGATGIFYWRGASGTYELILPDAQNVAQELIDLHSVLVEYTIDEEVTSTSGIRTMIKEHDGFFYIMAVNEDSDPAGTTASFDLSPLGVQSDGVAVLFNEQDIIEFIDGTFSLQFDPFDTHVIIVKDWWEEDWRYKKEITIDHTKVQGDQTDFPVLISIDSDSELAAMAQDDGSDIVFVGKNELTAFDHEIEYFNSVTGELVAWVRIPYLSAGEDTVMHMYYGNSECVNQQNPEAVWDSNYVMVQHLNETSGLHKDSTGYQNHGVGYGGVVQSALGKIDGADEFAGDDDYIGIPYHSSLNSMDGITLEAWVKSDELATYNTIINGRMSTFGPYLLQSISTGFSFGLHLDGNWRVVYDTGYDPDTWYHVVGTYDRMGGPDNLKLYINGQETHETYSGCIDQSFESRTIGHNYGSGDRWFDGCIDEVRMSNIARSSNWITTTFMNQHDPFLFISLGGEEVFGFPPAYTVFVDGDWSGDPGDIVAPGKIFGYNAFNSIQDGIDAVMVAGDVIVFAGEYYENLLIDKTIDLIGQDRTTVMINGGGQGNVINVTEDGVSIREVTVTNSGRYEWWCPECFQWWYAGVSIQAKNTVIADTIITHNYNGICCFADETVDTDAIIKINTISNNDNFGIYLWKTTDNTIMDNTFSENTYHNIGLQETSANTVIRNAVHRSITGYGVWLDQASDNTISENNITQQGIGMYLEDASIGNTIYYNNVTNNQLIGVYLKDSSNNNVIYNNNFIDNGLRNAQDEGMNFWNTIHPFGGNYWDDYQGVNKMRGPDQDIPGCDNIGDTPYHVYGAGEGQDEYPLLHRYDPSRPVVNLDTKELFGTIQGGIDADSTLDQHTLFIWSGEYYENVEITKRINLTGQDNTLTIIDGGATGDTIFISADWVNISWLNIRGSGYDFHEYDAGIDIRSRHNNISNNIIKANLGWGIMLYASTENSIYKNNITYNNLEHIGLYYSSNNNHIKQNYIRGNAFMGIAMYSSCDNTLSKNNISWINGTGILIYQSSNNNIITENDLYQILYYGVKLTENSNGNLIFHNNLKKSGLFNGYDECDNTWHNGYSIPYNPETDGGNYWDDFEVVVGQKFDDYCGIEQLDPGSDGIIDLGSLLGGGLNPYPVGIDGDLYPFMNKNGWNIS